MALQFFRGEKSELLGRLLKHSFAIVPSQVLASQVLRIEAALTSATTRRLLCPRLSAWSLAEMFESLDILLPLCRQITLASELSPLADSWSLHSCLVPIGKKMFQSPAAPKEKRRRHIPNQSTMCCVGHSSLAQLVVAALDSADVHFHEQCHSY